MEDALMARVLRHRSAIKDAATRHGASNLRVFGSVARGEASPQSDIDLLVTLAPGRTLFDLARLRSELEQILEASVDVVADTGLTDPEIIEEALAL